MVRYDAMTIGLMVAVGVLVVVVIFLLVRGKKDEGMDSTHPGGHHSKGGHPPHHPREGGQGGHPGHGGGHGSSPTLVLFHAEWCPHCKDMMGDWQQVKQALAQSPITVKEFESKDGEMGKHRVAGFPTLRFFPGGLSSPEKFVDYKGSRDAKSILEWLSQGAKDPSVPVGQQM